MASTFSPGCPRGPLPVKVFPSSSEMKKPISEPVTRRSPRNPAIAQSAQRTEHGPLDRLLTQIALNLAARTGAATFEI